MSKASRDKGRRGQREAQALLASRDWRTAELNAGTAVEDMIATDPDGKAWAVEVKNTVSITTAHREQAMTQGRTRRLPWMLLSKIAGTGSWLVQRRGHRPAVWHESTDQQENDE